MRLTGPARSSWRGMVRVTAVTLVVTAAGMTAGSAPAVSQQAVTVSLRYACAFPSGSRPVSAQVTSTFPVAAPAGKPIQPTGAQIAVTLPEDAIAGLAQLRAAAVRLTAGLTAAATEGPAAATITWRDFTSPAAAIPASGPLRLLATGTASPVTARSSGHVTVAAGALSLLFTAAPAGGPPASPSSTPASTSSTPGSQPGVQVTCLPRAGQDTTLATIAVTGTAQVRTPASPADNPDKCTPFPKNLKLNPLFPLPKPLPGSTHTSDLEIACSYAAGFTNARKLHEAVLVGPGLTDLQLGINTYFKFPKQYGYIYNQVAGQLDYHGLPQLPPARATLLGFGFTPVSATLQISEIGSLNAALISCSPNAAKYKCPPHTDEALFYGQVTLRIYDVDVNGVPLDVGPDCQTASPFDLELVGVPPTYNVPLIYGILTGTVNVPYFKDCGVGENLDPLFDATVSGPGNFVKINQAVLCTPTQPAPNGCPPAKAKPIH